MIRLAIFSVILLPFAGELHAQQLLDRGMFATGTMSRTRLETNNFQTGDMMYVSVLQPGNSGGMYVSAHMEYLKNDDWISVPTRDDDLGLAYRSRAYNGIRDYVQFANVYENTERHICLFMPYEAANLPVGNQYVRRYVLRLWDRNNIEVSNTILPQEVVSINKQAGRTVITVVQARACASFLSENGLQPVQESRKTGIVRFFNVRSGEWVCPGE